MELRKVNIGNGPFANANIAVTDGHIHKVIFLSILGYDSAVKNIIKDVNRRNSLYIEKQGNYGTGYKEYDVEKFRDPDTDYAHATITIKDSVKKLDNGNEQLTAYIYTEMDDSFDLNSAIRGDAQIPQELKGKIFDKLYHNTPVPLVDEWLDYITTQLVRTYALSEMRVFKPNNINFRVFKLSVRANELFQILLRGLQERFIGINGTNTSSEQMQEVHGMDSYLGSFTEILADDIQSAFAPKFVPGEDSYNENLSVFADYAEYKGLKLYDAQKAIIQATSNNLDQNKSSFVIAEMG